MSIDSSLNLQSLAFDLWVTFLLIVNNDSRNIDYDLSNNLVYYLFNHGEGYISDND